MPDIIFARPLSDPGKALGDDGLAFWPILVGFVLFYIRIDLVLHADVVT